MDNKITYDDNKYRKALKEKFGNAIDQLEPIKKKFVHLTMVCEMINDKYGIFSENFKKESEKNEELERISHVFLIVIQHMDMLHDKINSVKSKYLNRLLVIDNFDNTTLMLSWMNIIVMCMHITKQILPIINIINQQNLHVGGDVELTEDFKEFLSLMRYMTNMSEEFENYMIKVLNEER